MSRLMIFAIAASLACASFCAAALSLAPPVEIKHLEGAWIGRDNSGAFYRISLDDAGRGLLVIQEDAETNELSLYQIRGTGLVANRIAFALRPVGEADASIRVAGEAYHGDLKLIRSGKYNGGNWSLAAELEPEESLLPRIEAVRKASSEYYGGRQR